MSRIVVKVGSNVLTRPDGKLDITRMSSLADQIVWLRREGHEVILVSSGSVTGGRGEIQPRHRLGSVEERQLYSAVGQTKLINSYYNLFRGYDVHVGQVLTMKESFATRREYLNQRACMSVMLANDVLPIVNENDTVSVTELMFTDNDELSGLIASMMDADTLILLSNIDGIYDGDPADPAAHVIEHVDTATDLSACITRGKSEFGRGGMITKYNTARRVAEEGIRVIIANGRRDGILIDLLRRPDSVPHTTFLPAEEGVSTMKKWIAHSGSFAKGIVRVNASAAEALRGERATSLLLVGVTAIEGDFEDGDIVTIADHNGATVAIGRSAYDSDEARQHIGEHGMRPIVHYDYMYME